ncbi:MAG: LacI family DNA-binding transcriptional regulator [Jatrophihabitans sp.]
MLSMAGWCQREAKGPMAKVARGSRGRLDRRPTLEDVAARAGVSRALVSIVMRAAPGASDATRQRVLAVAEELGYRPDGRARLLAGARTRLLGVTLALNNPFHADVAEGIYAAAEPLGYQVVLSAVTHTRTPSEAIETLLSYRCEAVLLVGPLVQRKSLGALGEQLPVVVVGQPAPHPAVDVVRAADADGMRLAVDHLVELGHRRIVHAAGARAPGAAVRRRSYRTAMTAHGLTDQIKVLAGGEREEDGAASAQTMVEEGLPDAVITYNDRSAVGLLDVFARSTIAVPGAVSVVGYDDSQVARLPYLRLTTVSQDIPTLAELAVGRAVARLQNEPVADRELILAPHLVIRGTTGPGA